LSQHREVVEHGRQVLGDPVDVAARERAHAQILAHAQERKHLAPLRHVADAQAHDLVRIHAPDFAALVYDATLLWVHDTANRFQHGGLASAVGAGVWYVPTLRQVEGDAADGHDRAVTGL